MGISVKEALTFDGLSNAKVLAGKEGMDRMIKRVSVLECPDYDDYKVLLREGDFFLTSFYAVKDDERSVYNIVKILVESGSSGLCIIDAYFDSISAEAREYADSVSYPILLISRDVPYADIITDIMDAIIQTKDNTIMEMKINEILQPGREPESIARLAHEINPSFKNNIVSLYLNAVKGYMKRLVAFRNEFSRNDNWSMIEYRKGILIILSFEEDGTKFVNTQLQGVVKEIEFYNANFKLGVSNFYKGLHNLSMSINEAIFACDAGRKIIDKNIIRYNNLGVYKFLLPLQNRPEIRKFHDEIILPIMDYDAKNNTQLLKTANIFVDNDSDIKKTAEALFQHVNTVRYRVAKIKEVLKMEDLDGDFYEQLAIAVKLHKIL